MKSLIHRLGTAAGTGGSNSKCVLWNNYSMRIGSLAGLYI